MPDHDQSTGCWDVLPAPAYMRVAEEATALAVAAADTTMRALCRSTRSNSTRLERLMHTAHQHACQAQKYARWAQSWDEDGVSPSTLGNYARLAVASAVAAQAVAEAEPTAHVLHAR